MIGDKIKELRKSKKITQLELANTLGISAAAVGMYEQNRREPNYDLIKRLAEIFSVSVDYLIGYEEKLNSNVSYKTNDINSLVDDFLIKLSHEKNLTFDGENLSKNDIEKIINAINVGVKIALDKNS